LVVFVDLLGFGVLIPLVPFYAVNLGLTPGWVTLVIALHSLFQFIGAPILGRLSDRHGRRPVLAFSMAGHAAAYLLLGFSDSIALLVLSRMLSGFTSGNLATAYAYIADVCPPEKRAAGLARVSSAFALGFALGPLLGGYLAGGQAPADADLHRPALAAALLSLLSFATIWILLPESHHPDRSPGREAQPALTRLKLLRADTPLALMVGLGLLVFLFASMRESLLALWAHDKHRFDTQSITLLFTINGLGIAAMQFFATGAIVERLGEVRTLRVGIAAFAFGWLTLVLANGFAAIAGGILLGAVAMALFGTSLQTLVSGRASGSTRGAVMGVYQSSGSLARFVGAAYSGSLYGALGFDAPFLFGALMMLPALALTVTIARRLSRGESNA
jgi:DHA1 family tetracycline resistance protein-like MFS transporter